MRKSINTQTPLRRRPDSSDRFPPLLFQIFSLVLLLLFSLDISASAQTIIYNYDETSSTNGKGRLTSVSDDSGMTKFFYDEMGRTTRSEKTVDGTIYISQTSYDTLGRVASVRYPDNTSVNYVYNGPLLNRVYEGTTNYAQYTGYNALGQAKFLTFGNGVVTEYSINRLISDSTLSIP